MFDFKIIDKEGKEYEIYLDPKTRDFSVNGLVLFGYGGILDLLIFIKNTILELEEDDEDIINDLIMEVKNACI